MVHFSFRRARFRAVGGVVVVVAPVVAGLLLDAQVVGSIAGLLGAVAAVLGVWLPQRRAGQRQAGRRGGSGPARRSVTAPVGDAPLVLRGREAQMARLRAALARPAERFVVVAGLAGVGKSALALALYAHAADRRGRHTWWVSARTPETFVDGIVAVAELLGADATDVEILRAGNGRAHDVFWELLSQADRGWLLIIDDADEFGVLGALDGTGWIRPSRRGLVLVTSRINSGHLWGHAADVITLGPLAEEPATLVLLDLVDGGSAAQARSLARRLGGLALALRVAGSDIGWEFSRWESFASYERALESEDVTDVLRLDGGVDGPPEPRRALETTFELSLTSLGEAGVPYATPLLRLLSCYTPHLPIPVSLLTCAAVRSLLDDPARDADRHLHRALRGLAQLSLVTEGHLERGGTRTKTVSLHPLVSETSRSQASGGTHRVAVDAVVTALDPLRADDSRTWPLAAVLIPHVRQLLATSTPYLGEEHHAGLLDAAARLVAAAAWSGATVTSEQLAVDALTHTTSLGDDHTSRLNLSAELAWAIGRNGRWDTARAMLTSLLGVWERQTDPPLLAVLDVRHKLAWATGKTGSWEPARTQLAAVARQRRHVLGDDHPDTLHTRCCLAWAMWRTGSGTEAEAEYRRVIADRRQVLGDDHVEVLDAYYSLAEGYVLDGRHEEAETVLRTAIAHRDRILGYGHPETLDNCPRYWLGRALQGQGRYAEASELLGILLREQTALFGADHPATAAIRARLSEQDDPTTR
ncbi:tetratricopeptide repeat protein [Micromonospora rifamycinica]|uniref:tetratricopeptide repeat protein n=1 Tax=Micromonospora rifamycinica TaxID=291594 RepID=UPI0034287FB2